MNLRNCSGPYSIGLDMGTGSVGWAVTDGRGKLLHFKKQPTWGSRLFDSAQPASEARVHRGQRRRYVRRRWRLDLLQALFVDEMAQVDPGFFDRINHSRTIEGDPIFAKDFTKADYYDNFPTIYHLRAYLMETDEQADLRLIYLAIHNIVKHRGNFLRQGEKLTAKTAKTSDALKKLNEALLSWCESREYECEKTNEGAAARILADERSSRSQKAKDLQELVKVETGDSTINKKLSKALASAIVGLQCEFKDIFGDFECEATKLALSDDEKLEALQAACPDDSTELLDAICGVYSAYVLQGLLSYAEGETISRNMIKKYECYANDLDCLKSLVRAYAPDSYNSMFRGATYHDANADDPSRDYDASKAAGYTAYNLHKLPYDDLAKSVKKLFAGTGAESDERYIQMMDAFDKQRFLRRLKTSDNGAIYYQLHLEELQAILENQGRFYSFLKTDADKIESLVTFRIPYYVGPLTPKNAAQDSHGKCRFQWSERKPGMDDAVITPWNWESVIDKNKSAENFIMRMTGDCTYLAGEKVLPKQSLLYEEFCVLNELNGVRWSEDGDTWCRLDAAQREGIIQDLFHEKRRVTYKMIADWLVREGDARSPIVRGGQGESGLESRMGSYIFFAKDIFGVGELSSEDFPVIEKIILWNTLFEDRSILKEKLQSEFGPDGSGILNADQIKKICKKRLTGWGRLSKKFLTGIKVDTQTGRRMSIMDVLREGNPNSDRRLGETMVMMEILHDNALGFQEKIDEANREFYAVNGELMGVNELPGSPAIRRSLNQAIRIVDEIAKIAGHAPANIFIEVTRDEDERRKGKRTVKRWDRIEEALKAFKAEGGELAVMGEFKELKAANVDLDERLTLYLMQNGKCLYSGRAIDLEKLISGSGDYEVDHIIPRAYIKDDSLENKALVYREANQRKTDQLLIDENIRRKMSVTWSQLHHAKMIGDKKYRNLLRSHINENTMKGFVARQLVETSQMVKMAQALLETRYADAGTKVVPVKASMSHNLREAAGLVKCREANDFHHAHDAYLACRLGLFIQMRHPGIYENPIGYAHVVQQYVREQSELFKKTHRMPGSAGFVVNSFMTAGFDSETGEVFDDAWPNDDEVKRYRGKYLPDGWNAAAEVDGIRKALNYRQCYISRMPQEDTGAFWKATIYSPRDPKMGPKLALPTKQELDPKQYGGFSSQQFAYFFIYEAKKKGKPTFQFSQVPVWLAARIDADPSALDEYARELAENEGLEYVGITRSKIYKKQLIEVDGERLILRGKKELISAREVAIDQEGQRAILGDPDCSIEAVLAQLSASTKIVGTRISRLIELESIAERSKGLSYEDKVRLVKNLCPVLNGSCDRIDLSCIGGPKRTGTLQVVFTKLLNESKTPFYIVDQSVTGMFERRTRVGL